METVRFDELDLYPQVLRAIKEMGFEEATPIQSQAIPVVMSGVDVIGQAQTGTGKTASFGIPVLHKVDPNNKKTQVIILSPTRELAIQVSEEIRKLSKYMHGVKILPVRSMYPGFHEKESWVNMKSNRILPVFHPYPSKIQSSYTPHVFLFFPCKNVICAVTSKKSCRSNSSIADCSL